MEVSMERRQGRVNDLLPESRRDGYTPSMDFAIAVLVAAALLAAALAVLRDRRTAAPRRTGARRGPGPTARGSEPRRAAPLSNQRRRETGAGACPLCRKALGSGERIKSDLSPAKGPGEKDRLMRIFGCPHCWPPQAGTPRTCPVCGRELAPEAWVFARYFERPGRRHVHVLGCLECRGGKR
ncbi:MAG: hypothetical protein M0Z80_06185 [Treponema sp.]|nr:hypothetical protein [Treponema sp.]